MSLRQSVGGSFRHIRSFALASSLFPARADRRGREATTLWAGASRAEVIEALFMAIYTGAARSVMYANQALAVFGQFKSQQGEPSVGAGLSI